VYEDDHALAFLDIMPPGIRPHAGDPKAPARNILDISREDLRMSARGAHKSQPPR